MVIGQFEFGVFWVDMFVVISEVDEYGCGGSE